MLELAYYTHAYERTKFPCSKLPPACGVTGKLFVFFFYYFVCVFNLFRHLLFLCSRCTISVSTICCFPNVFYSYFLMHLRHRPLLHTHLFPCLPVLPLPQTSFHFAFLVCIYVVPRIVVTQKCEKTFPLNSSSIWSISNCEFDYRLKMVTKNFFLKRLILFSF